MPFFQYLMQQPSNHVRNIAVLGAGTMGSGIAAHLANLGYEVTLFDLTNESAGAGLERAKRIRPPHFFGPEAASRVRVAGFDGPLDAIREADWVCEAILEKLDAKRSLYREIESLLRPDAMISTNTSGLEIQLLAEGLSDGFRSRFMGTHFFNPPRYLKLIELIPTQETSAKEIGKMTAFLEDYGGRRVVQAKDTPGFIANRYGMWVLMHALHTAEKLGFSSETVDAITGPFMGRPKSGTMRLADLIGFDIIADICGNLIRRCENDPYTSQLQIPATMAHLGNSGWIGNKAGQGYYKKEGDQFLTYDSGVQQYRPRLEAELPGIDLKTPLGERLRISLKQGDEVGEFVREHIPAALGYATYLGPQIAYSVSDFDNVMKWGWGWSVGPFELLDEIGYDNLTEFLPDAPLRGQSPFYGDGTELNLEKLEQTAQKTDARFATIDDFEITNSGNGWALRDDGMGGHIFEFRKKMGAIDSTVVNALVELLSNDPDARITLASAQPAFSVGYDLLQILQFAEEARFEEMGTQLRQLQQASRLLSNAKSAAAVHGYGLGGGFELALRCKTVVAHNEAILGLPETLVGLIPAGGGTTEMRRRTNGDAKRLCAAASSLAGGRKFMAAQARKFDFLRSADVVTANPDSLLFRVLHAERNEIPHVEWTPAPPMTAGMIDAEIDQMRADKELGEYGESIATEIKHIFVKSTSEAHALEMEIEGFLKLMGKPRTHLRIRHMLETGKPVSN